MASWAVTGGPKEKKRLRGAKKYHYLLGQVKSKIMLLCSTCNLCDLRQGRDAF